MVSMIPWEMGKYLWFKKKLRWRLFRSAFLLRGTFPTVLWTLTEEPGKVIFPIFLSITPSWTLSNIYFLPLFICPFFTFFHEINERKILWSIPLSVWAIPEYMFSISVMKVSDCPNGSRINKALGWWMYLSLFFYFCAVMVKCLNFWLSDDSRASWCICPARLKSY